MNESITLEDILVYFHDVLKDKSINCYRPEIDNMSGSIGWSKGGNDPIIWATPNFHSNGVTPFDIQWCDMDTYETYCEIDFSDRSHDEQYKIYFTILSLAIDYVENKVNDEAKLRIV